MIIAHEERNCKGEFDISLIADTVEKTAKIIYEIVKN